MTKNKKTFVIKSSDKTAMQIMKENLELQKNRAVRFYDEDGYELTHPDDIKELMKRVRAREKERFLAKNQKRKYKLSRWAEETVKILEENGEMKNVDIIDELRKRGCNTSANHINKFFKSEDGKRFYKEQLIGNQGYWSIANDKKSKGVSIPIMITNKMRIELSTLGYSKEEMKYLTPIESHKIINKGVPKKPSKDRGRNQ
tara:strand:- start:116 stop:718 length:603 start_codon:yes stop_codon:yes gene_type:complete